MQPPPSTAGIANSDKNDTTSAKDCYKGPYLLPYIDLLNHSPRGSPKHVTTLRRDADGSFLMVAERDIATGEEICHSYDSGAAVDDYGHGTEESPAPHTQVMKEESSSLNSAQLLQTFGFVDTDGAGGRLLEHYRKKEKLTDRERASNLGNTTPAMLTKKEISCACKKLATSSYPNTLRGFMDHSGMLDEGWEHWQMPILDESSPRWESLALFSDEFIVPFGEPLSDELITICCLHFLPDDAIKEILDESGESGKNQRQSLLLGNEVLEDYFLGNLVLHSIISCLKEKLNTYKVYSGSVLARYKHHDRIHQFLEILGSLYHSESRNGDAFCWGESETEDARVLMEIMPSCRGRFSNLIEKFRYGMVISLEERTCLSELKKNMLKVLAQLNDE